MNDYFASKCSNFLLDLILDYTLMKLKYDNIMKLLYDRDHVSLFVTVCTEIKGSWLLDKILRQGQRERAQRGKISRRNPELLHLKFESKFDMIKFTWLKNYKEKLNFKRKVQKEKNKWSFIMYHYTFWSSLMRWPWVFIKQHKTNYTVIKKKMNNMKIHSQSLLNSPTSDQQSHDVLRNFWKIKK